MKIEVTNPVDHNGTLYDRGIQDLPDDVAKLFLTYTWAARKVEVEDAPEKPAKRGK